MACSGTAPTWRAMISPLRSSNRVGIACTPNRCCSRGASSTLTLTSLIFPAISVATFSRAGLTIRQGPHHGAHSGNGRGLGDLGEVVLARVGDPRQRLVAVAALRVPRRRGGHPVPAPAVRARHPLVHKLTMSTGAGRYR